MKNVFGQELTFDDMKKLQGSIEEAHKDDTPFPVVTKEGLTVVGDPNKTENKSHDYIVEFHFTPAEIKRYGIPEEMIERWVQGEAIVHQEYKDVQVKPRYKVEIDASLVKLLSYFLAYNEEEKRVENRTDEEQLELVKAMSKEIGDDIYDFVAAMLQMDRKIVDNMEWTSVIENANKLIIDFPEVLNGSESTFPGADGGRG